MDGLADIAVQYFCTMLFGDTSNIDPDFASKEMQSFPHFVSALSDAERASLARAAKRALEFSVGTQELNEQIEGNSPQHEEGMSTFLEMLSSGEIYQQWCG